MHRLTLRDVTFQLDSPDSRPALLLNHIDDAELVRVRADHAAGTPALVQQDVTGLVTRDCRDLTASP